MVGRRMSGVFENIDHVAGHAFRGHVPYSHAPGKRVGSM